MLDHEATKPVETLKGEYVKRKPDAKKVYVVAGYDRHIGKWQLDDTDDTSRCIYVARGTMLYAGFTY
jgi:hypothetical protein